MDAGKAIAVWEMEIPARGRVEWVRLTASYAGRDGTLTKTWKVLGGHLDATQIDDMQLVIAQVIADAALFALGGIQTVL